MGCMKQYL